MTQAHGPEGSQQPGSHGHALENAVSAVLRALDTARVPMPSALVVSSTGCDRLAQLLQLDRAFDVSSIDAAPRAFRAQPLRVGEVDGHVVWVADNDATPISDGAPWERAFSIWLAARAGAKAFVHTSAGTALRTLTSRPGGDESSPLRIESGAVVRVSDHINLSGRSPLLGLGQSKLGPLFPDQTRVHDPALAALLDSAPKACAIAPQRVVAACTLGPALATPAEFRWYEAAGAEIAVQGLADPLIAASHAGLRTLSLCAITDRSDETVEVGTLVERSAAAAACLDLCVEHVVRGFGPWVSTLLAAEAATELG